jgi:hypothetical protein
VTTASENRVARYLTSTKNLMGAAGGVIGLIITFLGLAGPYWPLVVIGLYLAGALAAPPEKIRLVLEDATGLLAGLLDRPDALTTAPDQMYAITRAIRTDLPESIESYLNIPWWYAATRRINGQRTAAEELTAQLELLEHDLTGTADQVYGADAQRLRDQTRYLEERTSPRELDIPGRARQDNTDVS